MRGFLLFFLSCACWGQITTGGIVGTIKDSTGAVIANAPVRLINEGTNISQQTKTNGTGDYVFPNLQPAVYSVHAESAGFRRALVEHVPLSLNATVRQDIVLLAGGVEQSVTVTAELPVVNSETASVAAIVDQHAAQNLPIDGRTLDMLVLLTPGLTSDSASNPRVGGSLYWGGNNYSVDGVTINDAGNGGAAYSYSTRLTTTPSMDTVLEVKVESNNAKAEHEGSAAISMVTRSGSNRRHGALYEYNRNRAMTAKNFFAGALTKPQFNRNEFGGTTDGPIVKNKLFYFGSFEGLRQRTGRPPNLNVPAMTLRSGDFGRTVLRDPLSNDSFPGNLIPASRIDPRSRTLMGFYPEPNQAGAFNYNGNVINKFNVNRASIKADYKPAPKDSIAFSANYSVGDPYFIARGTPANYGNWENGGYTTKSAAANWTRTIGTRNINDLRLSYFSHASVRLGQNRDFNPQSIFPGLYGPPPVGGIPLVTITGYPVIGDYGGGEGAPQITTALVNNFTFVRGNHTFKAGVDLNRMRIATNPGIIGYGASPSSGAGFGSFTFNARYTGNAFADFLLGYPVSTARDTATLVNLLYQSRHSAYFQDDWKVSPRLTLNIGMRYMLQTQMQERDGSWSNFDLGSGTLVIRSVDGKLPRAAIPRLVNAYPYETSEKHGWGSDVTKADHNNFEPRFGFAFRPFRNARTVVRGGYGIYIGQIPAYIGIRQLSWSNTPFFLRETFEAAAGNVPSISLANPFPTGGGAVSPNPSLVAVNRQLRNAYAQQWNLTIERQLMSKVGLRVTYLGNKAARVPFYNYNRNLPRVQAPGTIQSQRPFQPFADISTLDTNGKSFTNQFQAELNRRFPGGLYIMSNFTLNKAIDNVPVSSSPQNPYDARAERSNSEGVRQLIFNTSSTYPLPFFRRGRLRNYLGGWNLAGIATFRSGTPFNVTFVPSLAGWYATRSDATGISPNVEDPSIARWFNPAAFKIPAPYTFGNAARNVLWGPGQMKLDVSLVKNVRIQERYNLNIRAEAFNLPNHPSFANPSASVTTPSTIGRISSTSVENRALQVALKLSF
ncbi:MAG: carboxypeptidase regulatory-like domain-containing protein [Candidatus Solibacter usitatus]|nr:carboxypeptidase regulatory-like domain-containing protein [Candidatus Solibacter usitatus]